MDGVKSGAVGKKLLLMAYKWALVEKGIVSPVSVSSKNPTPSKTLYLQQEENTGAETEGKQQDALDMDVSNIFDRYEHS